MDKEKTYKESYNMDTDKNGVLHSVRQCTFCEKEIKDKEDVSYTEDAEIAHSKCLQAFEQHWKDRDETLDLMGC